MNILRIILIVAAVLIVLVLGGTFYTLSETEQAIITQFGSPVGEPIREAGLHVKLPFVQKVTSFDKRLLEWDGSPNEIPTEDKKYIWVNTFARWRITEPLKFFQSSRNERTAQSRLDDILDGITRDVITQSTLIELVRNSNREMMIVTEDEDEMDAQGTPELAQIIEKGRAAISDSILKRASVVVPQYGIELVDLRIKHINYIERVRQKVYERMISERKRIAEKYRSEGQGERARIEGRREKELQRIQSEAYRRSQEIKGTADAEATRIYAEAYNRDPEFYSFLQTLETYRETLEDNSTMFLQTDTEFLKYLKSSRGQ